MQRERATKPGPRKWPYFYGKLRFARHHLLPTFSMVWVCDEEDYSLMMWKWFQVSWFGLSANLDWPVKKGTKFTRSYIWSPMDLFEKDETK